MQGSSRSTAVHHLPAHAALFQNVRQANTCRSAHEQGFTGLHLDFLEGIFGLVKVLQSEGHLVVQLSQPPVICLHFTMQNIQYITGM